MLAKMPPEITAAVDKEMRKMNWPEQVPAYVEFPGPDGRQRFTAYANLTVAIAEQATEYHIRRAKLAWKRFEGTGSKHTAKTAAWHIVRANVYRAAYFMLLNQPNPKRTDFPFPILSEEEAREANSETPDE